MKVIWWWNMNEEIVFVICEYALKFHQCSSRSTFPFICECVWQIWKSGDFHESSTHEGCVVFNTRDPSRWRSDFHFHLWMADEWCLRVTCDPPKQPQLHHQLCGHVNTNKHTTTSTPPPMIIGVQKVKVGKCVSIKFYKGNASRQEL